MDWCELTTREAGMSRGRARVPPSLTRAGLSHHGQWLAGDGIRSLVDRHRPAARVLSAGSASAAVSALPPPWEGA